MKRYKSVGFWVGIIGIVLAVSGNQISDFTSWHILVLKIYEIVMNPATVFGIIMAVYGSWNNPTNKGIN